MAYSKNLNILSATLFCAVAFAAHDVLAAGSHGTTHETMDELLHEAVHDDPSAGLPQFDPSSYPSQIMWLIVTFVIMYVFFSSKTLPDIAGVLENRRDHIQGDLETAESLKKEAEETQSAYESKLADARVQATKAVSDIHEKIKKKATDKQSAFREKANHEISSLEKRIDKATAQAMDDMDSIVSAVAQEAAQKIVGLKTDSKKVNQLVKDLNKKEAA